MTGPIPPNREAIPPIKDWTVLVYAGGVNNLDSYLSQSLQELAREAIPANVDVVVRHLDKLGHLTDLHLDQTGSQTLSAPPEPQDSCSPRTLAGLLELGMQRYPSRHYLVVISSHGRGAAGVIEDELQHGLMSPQGLREGLDQGRQGQLLDAVMFNACQMMSAEVACELHGCAQVMVGSIDKISGPGYDLRQVVQAASHSQDGFELARQLVGNQKAPQLEACNTLSAAALERTPELEAALAALSGQLAQLEPSAAQRVRELAAQTRRTTPSPATMKALDQLADYILGRGMPPDAALQDWLELSQPGQAVALLSFCRNLASDQLLVERLPGLPAACHAVSRAEQDAVLCQRHPEGEEDPGGLSLALPLQRLGEATLYPTQPHPLEFEKATGWAAAVATIVPQGVPAAPRTTWLEDELQRGQLAS